MNNDKQIIVKYIINIDEWVMWNRVYDVYGIAPCLVTSITGAGRRTPKVVVFE